MAKKACVPFLTFVTEGARVWRGATVAGEAVMLVQALASVLTQVPVAAAVAWASGADAWCDLRPLLQIQRLPVQLQRPDAAQEALLPWRGSSWRTQWTGCSFFVLPHILWRVTLWRGSSTPWVILWGCARMVEAVLNSKMMRKKNVVGGTDSKGKVGFCRTLHCLSFRVQPWHPCLFKTNDQRTLFSSHRSPTFCHSLSF